MPKAPTGSASQARKQRSAAQPYSKSNANNSHDIHDGSQVKKDPKQSHLYTDDNPSTTLHGTGFKNAETALRTVDLVKNRSLTYQWQVINTMYHRAKGHPSMKKGHGHTADMKEAMSIFETWLNETYPATKAKRHEEGKNFKPVLKKETVARYLDRINSLANENSADIRDCKRFAEIYAALPKGKRLANILLDDNHPEQADWEVRREQALTLLTSLRQSGEDYLWNDKGGASAFHIECIGWAWSPVGERRLPP